MNHPSAAGSPRRPTHDRRARGAISAMGAAACALLLPGCPGPTDGPRIGLELVAENLPPPVAAVFSDDGSSRVFVAGQTGEIWLVHADGRLGDEPFLDLSDKLSELDPFYDERGLLGLALHPDYAANGRLFVYYTAPPRDDVPNALAATSVLAEYRASADDPDRADPASERVLLVFGQPQRSHNGGQLAFGPDGYLYISTGDGGGIGDADVGHSPQGNAQDLANLLGKILRIDVDAGEPYAVPPGNPFVGRPDARPEIWAYGLRNPWRFSFDQTPAGQTRLFAGDVGQAIHEEINLIQRGGNYGWRIREGVACFDPVAVTLPPADCPDTAPDGTPLIDPIIDYTHADGTAVVGGVVYRGDDVPELAGRYIFGDFAHTPAGANGRLFVATESDDGTFSHEPLRVAGVLGGHLGRYLYALTRDPDGEVYVLTNDTPRPAGRGGRMWRIVPAD